MKPHPNSPASFPPRPLPPEVILPCDLPSWPTVQSRMLQLQSARDVDEAIEAMRRVRRLCDLSVNDGGEAALDDRLGALREIVATQFSDLESRRFVEQTLPGISRFAVSLRELRPAKVKFRYSLSGVRGSASQSLDRRFVASLLANAFLSTLPLRSTNAIPALPEFSFRSLFGNIKHSYMQASRLRSLLNYFDVLNAEEPLGHVVFTKHIVPRSAATLACNDVHGHDAETAGYKIAMRQAPSKPLAPIFVLQDEKKVDLDLNSASVSLRTLPALNGNAASTIGVAEEDFGVVEHPEILVSLIFMEKLGPNECLKVSGILSKDGGGANGDTDRAESNGGGGGGVDRSLEAVCVIDGIERSILTQREAFSELEQYIFCLGRIIKNEEICSAQPSTAVAADNKSSTVSSKSSELDRLADNLSMMLGPRDEDSRSAGDDASDGDNGQDICNSDDDNGVDDLACPDTRAKRRLMQMGDDESTSSALVEIAVGMGKSPEEISAAVGM